jgi:hypothetical protein
MLFPIFGELAGVERFPPTGEALHWQPVPTNVTAIAKQRNVLLPWFAVVTTRSTVQGGADVDGDSGEEFSGLQRSIQNAMLRRSFPRAQWRPRTSHEARTVA